MAKLAGSRGQLPAGTSGAPRHGRRSRAKTRD
jgi:hypothetical protein